MFKLLSLAFCWPQGVFGNKQFHQLTAKSAWGFAARYNSYKDVVLNKDEIERNFTRSSGPGGQHVNTTNSKAEIRLQLAKCYWIDEYIRDQMKTNCRLTKDGYLMITSQLHR